MSDLAELLERVKAATAGSNDLTADVYEALGYPVKRRREIIDKGWKRTRSVAWRYFENGRWLAMADLSGSIDAALALTERLLPGWWWLREDGQSIRLVGPDNGDCYPSAVGRHHLVPLAILAALLSALTHTAEGGDER